MRESKIEADNLDNIGPHATKLTLKLGDIQSMQFSSTNDGPCCMSPAQRLATKKDRPSVKTTSSDRLVQDLRKDLEGKGVSSMGTKKVIQQPCIEQSIPFQIIMEQIKRKITDWLVLDLRKDLDAKGENTGGNKKELQKRCMEAGIPVQITMTEITKGWEGKPKGMLQILFEQGLSTQKDD
jgi:hypothetical protein